jgi:hypothetical protein
MSKEIKFVPDEWKTAEVRPRSEPRRQEATTFAEGASAVIDLEYGAEVDPESETTFDCDFSNEEEISNFDDREFGFDFSTASERSFMRCDSLKRNEAGSGIDLKSKADCLNNSERIAPFDFLNRTDQLRPEDCESIDDTE